MPNVPTQTQSLGTNEFPLSEVYTPEDGFNLIQGGPSSTDTLNGKKSAPVALYIKDGNDVTAGAKADPPVTDATVTTATRFSFIKGQVKILADVWDSVNHWLQVRVMNTVTVSGTFWPTTQPVSLALLPASDAGTIAPAASQPNITGANTDTSYTLSAQARRFLVQNLSNVNASVELDATTGVSSVVLAPGAIWTDPIEVTTFHFLTASAVSINNGANGLVVKGWA